jgi:hypothetical protein
MLLAFIVKGTVPRDLKKNPFLHFVTPDSLAASFAQMSQNSLSSSSGVYDTADAFTKVSCKLMVSETHLVPY